MAGGLRTTQNAHKEKEIEIADIELSFDNIKLIELLNYRGILLAKADYANEKKVCDQITEYI